MNIISKNVVAMSMAVTLGFASLGSTLSIANLGCPILNVKHTHEQNTSINDCVTIWASNQSWFSWLSGKSRSAQFHFIDFVELVYKAHKVHEEL